MLWSNYEPNTTENVGILSTYTYIHDQAALPEDA